MNKYKNQNTSSSKALTVNLDDTRYGTFAEIGAGQEVARHFFLAGKASQTIAKTISAYDMIYSDEIYGKEKSGRYVCESRLLKMLDKEFNLLIRRLDSHRGDKTSFFAFADTVATGTPESPRCHGWLGVRFQSHPKGQANDIIIHVRMQDKHRIQQQEALGVLGVNLIHSAFYVLDKPEEFVSALVENLKPGQVMIDAIKFNGVDLKKLDTATVNIELVRRGLSEAVMFDPQLQVLNIGDALYGKSPLIQRGRYRPITKSHVDVLEKGLVQLKKEKGNGDCMPILEIMVEPGKYDKDQDYLDRIHLISKLGYHVLISNLPLFYQLKRFLRRYTQKPMAIVADGSHLERIFDETPYKNLEGGLIEGLGKLLDNQTKIYIYPHKTDRTCLTAKNFTIKGPMQDIYQYFYKMQMIEDLAGCDEINQFYHSEDVAKLIRKKDKAWESLVPNAIKNQIDKNGLFRN